MPQFKFIVTRDVTESALAIVTADTIEEAQAIALSRDYEANLEFQPDDGSGDETYLSDPDEWEVLSEDAE